MIHIQSVTKTFGKKRAVDNLTLTLEPGTITGFIGPNGAGKTTTIRMLCGVLKPDSGTITINGKDILLNPVEAKHEFGFIADSPDVFLALKGTEYINFVCNIYGVDPSVRASRMEELLSDFEMKEAVSQKLETYSHGMRQKIHIIATLMHDPSVWIMDEPMTGLDPQSSYLLKQRMKRHAQEGKTVLFSTHVLEVAERLCDQIAIINKGALCYTGTLEALKEQYPALTLEEIFLKVTGSRVIEENGAESSEGDRDDA